MSAFCWQGVLNGRGNVVFSSLEIPEDRDEFEDDVAELRLNSGLSIDVTWVHDCNHYVVTMFRDEFENQILRFEVESSSEVVELVGNLVDNNAFDDDQRYLTLNASDMTIDCQV